MFQVSDGATEVLAVLLDRTSEGDEEVLRLVVTDDGLGLVLDKSTDDDAVFDHEGKNVLAVGPNVSDLLDERTLDVDESKDAVELTLK